MKGMRKTLQAKFGGVFLSDDDRGDWSPYGEQFDERTAELADAALAALGLDDFDAAVDRAANALGHLREGDPVPTEQERIWARAMLEAALLATDSTGGTDAS